jgi:hypothetical protein
VMGGQSAAAATGIISARSRKRKKEKERRGCI